MKELTIEEKAKRYDRAFGRAKARYDKGAPDSLDLEEMFPELKESEDDKIRKEIIDYIKTGTYKKDWIAWLEKQGEEDYSLKSYRNEDVHKFVQYIEKEAKAYDLNLPNRSYDIYAFAKDILAWLEKQENINRYKVGAKTTIDGVEGYIIELDNTGKPTVLCSELLGEMSWYDAMKKANKGPWHLPPIKEWKKYYKAIKEIDNNEWNFYWTSTEHDSLYAYSVDTNVGGINDNAKTLPNYVRAFAYVGSKKTKIGDKVIIDDVEGYVLDIDDNGEPTVLCSELLGEMSWYDAMKKANWGAWHLPTDDELKQYHKIIKELDSGDWHFYWSSTEDVSFYARFVSTHSGRILNDAKTLTNCVRAFTFVGSKNR